MENKKRYTKEIIEKITESYIELLGGYEMLFDSIYKIKLIEKENNIKIIEPNKDPYESFMDILISEYFKEAIRKKPELAVKTIELFNELREFFEISSNLDLINANAEEVGNVIAKIKKIKGVFLELVEMTKGD